MQNSNIAILTGSLIVGSIILLIGYVNYGFNFLPLLEEQAAERAALVETFPVLDKQEDLTIDQRISLLKKHHILSVEQDTELTLMNNRHFEERVATDQASLLIPVGAGIIVIGIFIPISREIGM